MIFRIMFYVLKSISDFLSSRLRMYYYLSKIQTGTHTNINLPVNIVCKRVIKMGANCTVGKHAALICAGEVYIGDNASIQSLAKLVTGRFGKLNIGVNFKVEAATISTNKEWSIGDNVTIASQCAIFSREKAEGQMQIGNNTRIGNGCIIDVAGDLNIGNNVSIGTYCTIYTHNHKYDNPDVGAWEGGIVTKSVNIEDGVWIGSNVTILPGVTIGKRAVVAAGAIVTKNVQSETIVGGNPAKFIKKTIE